jgi:hypothetical protein
MSGHGDLNSPASYDQRRSQPDSALRFGGEHARQFLHLKNTTPLFFSEAHLTIGWLGGAGLNRFKDAEDYGLRWLALSLNVENRMLVMYASFDSTSE